ncbi:uncharacterized protein LOC114326888 [Diabrotica virgifera virgifera]|uniref:MADF domain-containing protein n=1 Tax=Diabrotica virgifera virgifera TaxID=50390 RepID=A0ABM5IEL6_DIAVI|nr:uncharacterized protein LOC114326888 [Diabrotica virgifera virgifera]
MECGQLFSSFNEFNNILTQYEKDKRQKFVIKGSRSIKMTEKILKRKLKEDLKYYEVQYICVHGGAVRRRGKGIRKTRTYKMNCPAAIKLRATKTGDFLQIKQLVERHENHEMSEVVYDDLPTNRKLNANEQSIVENLMDVRENKKLIQQKILCSAGKLSTTKDLSNIAYGMKSSSNELEHVAKELKDIYTQDCKTRWRTLRDLYNRKRKLIKKPTGTAASMKASNWDYLDNMSFLRKFPKKKGSLTNVPGIGSLDPDEIRENDEETIADTEETEVEKVQESSNPKRSLEETEILKQNVNNKRNTDRVIAAMENRYKERNELFRELLSAPSASLAAPETNPIITFFQSMAQTVMTFPPHLAVEAKAKVCQIVTDLEYRSISQYQQPSHSSQLNALPRCDKSDSRSSSLDAM